MRDLIALKHNQCPLFTLYGHIQATRIKFLKECVLIQLYTVILMNFVLFGDH